MARRGRESDASKSSVLTALAVSTTDPPDRQWDTGESTNVVGQRAVRHGGAKADANVQRAVLRSAEHRHPLLADHLQLFERVRMLRIDDGADVVCAVRQSTQTRRPVSAHRTRLRRSARRAVRHVVAVLATLRSCLHSLVPRAAPPTLPPGRRRDSGCPACMHSALLSHAPRIRSDVMRCAIGGLGCRAEGGAERGTLNQLGEKYKNDY
jgi:hypothetical protein